MTEDEKLTLDIAQIINDKKGGNIVILKLKDFIVDFFVICSGKSERHIKTISNELEREIKKRKIQIIGIEGYNEAKWVLMDFGTIVVHVFDEKHLEYYDLEFLWDDSERLEWNEKDNTRKNRN